MREKYKKPANSVIIRVVLATVRSDAGIFARGAGRVGGRGVNSRVVIEVDMSH